MSLKLPTGKYSFSQTSTASVPSKQDSTTPPGVTKPSLSFPVRSVTAKPTFSAVSVPPPGVRSTEQGLPESVASKQTSQVETIERAQNAYKQLSVAAKGLNDASDELGQVVILVDKALKKLNLGIAAWVKTSGNDGCPPDGSHWWSREIGYGKVGDKWGVAIRELEGDHRSGGDTDKQELWLFNEAPRWMRLESIGKIPEILERLVKQSEDTTQSIRKKTAQASEIALAIFELAEESQPGEQK